VWADQDVIQSSIGVRTTANHTEGPGQRGCQFWKGGLVLTRLSWEFRFAVVRTDQAVALSMYYSIGSRRPER